ncbi:MAG: hypothetical protein Kow0027_03250 [Saprospiraceae bacterium]
MTVRIGMLLTIALFLLYVQCHNNVQTDKKYYTTSGQIVSSFNPSICACEIIIDGKRNQSCNIQPNGKLRGQFRCKENASVYIEIFLREDGTSIKNIKLDLTNTDLDTIKLDNIERLITRKNAEK